jgi:hypothetical protein
MYYGRDTLNREIAGVDVCHMNRRHAILSEFNFVWNASKIFILKRYLCDYFKDLLDECFNVNTY